MEDQRPKGHCKHGEFVLSEGCPQCIAEYQALAGPTDIVKVRYFSETTGELSACEYSYFTEELLALGDVVQVPVKDRIGKAKVTAINVPENEIIAFRDKIKTIPSGSKRPPTQAEDFKSEPFNPDDIQGRLVVDEAASAEAGTLIADLVTNQENETSQEGFTAEDWNKEVGQEYQPGPTELGSPAEPDQEILPTRIATIAIAPKSDDRVLDLYQEGVKLLQFAQTRIISTNADLKPATDDLAIIANTMKVLEEKKADYVGPIRQHLNAVNEAFKELLFPFEEADRITREKVKEFRQIEADKMVLARREAVAKGGEITVELQEPVPDRTRTAMGTQGFQKVYKWDVVDFAQVPDQYKIINSGMVTGVVKGSKGKISIPGIRIYEEETVRINTNRGKS